jgi:Flp pilus assembly protein TadG
MGHLSMRILLSIRCVWELLRSFRRAQSANVAIMFGLTLVPLLGIAGAAIDYSRAASDRTKMQAAVDTTALMLAREAPGMTDADIQQKAQDYFKALMGNSEVYSLTITSTYSSSGGTRIDLTGAGDVKTAFMGLLGVHVVPIKTAATAQWGNTRLRVTLVLDNTGSMAQSGKMTALKTATKNLLQQLKDTAKDKEDVYVSIIPFSKDVNVGSGNKNAAWLRWDLWDAANGTCTKSASTASQCATKAGVWTPKSHNLWNGCVTDRDKNFDTTNDNPTTTVLGSLFPAEQYSSCPVSLLSLTNDWAALNTKVDAMTPVGNTNQTIGLQWGFQSILATSPLFVPSQAPGYEYDEIVVLLTDGLNTQNRWDTLQSNIDARTKIVCDNLKKSATVYSIQVNTGGDPQSAMLENCASGSSRYHMLTSATEIIDTFNDIGTELSKLRLSY